MSDCIRISKLYCYIKLYIFFLFWYYKPVYKGQQLTHHSQKATLFHKMQRQITAKCQQNDQCPIAIPCPVERESIYFHFLTKWWHTYYCTGQILGTSANQITQPILHYEFGQFRIVYNSYMEFQAKFKKGTELANRWSSFFGSIVLGCQSLDLGFNSTYLHFQLQLIQETI